MSKFTHGKRINGHFLEFGQVREGGQIKSYLGNSNRDNELLIKGPPIYLTMKK